MPSLSQIEKEDETYTIIKKYAKKLSERTNRNVIVYYSGWLSTKLALPIDINDMDKNGFMSMCHGLDFNKGLDLILHTPGGDVAATESIIDYLNKLFNGDIRAIVPQLAMSGGTMISCSCKEIIMGKQSSLGPVDPQIRGVPAYGVISEFNKIKQEVDENPSIIEVWKPILSQYHPTFIWSCYQAIDWSNELLETSLKNNMFKNNPDDKRIDEIVAVLGTPKDTKHHSRHLNPDKCIELGLNVTFMENDDIEQDLILSIHHACMTMFNKSRTFKIFANNNDEFLDFKYGG